MYAEQIKQQYHSGTIAGGAIGVNQIGQHEPSPRSSLLDGAISRADACSQEMSTMISILEDRLERVLTPPVPQKEAVNSVGPDSGAPIIRALDELNHRQAMAAQRLRGLIERLAV